jgi:23S rRNA (uracil1939-C5)-methyltransferase
MQKNDCIPLTVTAYSSDGSGLGHAPDGRVVFVPHAARGDVLTVRVVKAAARHCFGRIEEIITPSEHRMDPGCGVYPKCGGCRLRHLTYAEELDLKRRRVEDALTRIGGVTIPLETVIPSPKTDGYRNKCAAPVGYFSGGGVVTGFYRAGSHDIVPNTHCALQRPEADQALAALRSYAAEAPTGLLRHGVVRVARDGGAHLCAIAFKKPPNLGRLADLLQAHCPAATGLSYHVNKEPGNAIWGAGPVRPVWGQPEWNETLCGLTVSLSPKAFFQVNPGAAELLYGLVLDWAGTADTALDLYCGAGVLTCLLARKIGHVTGVDLEPSAIEAARSTAARNGSGAEFLCADAAHAFTQWQSDGKRPGLVTADPPRSGLSAAVLEGLAALSPPRILYVSCDPATMARDIKHLAAAGYRAERAAAADMFPRTPHVECVVSLAK